MSVRLENWGERAKSPDGYFNLLAAVIHQAVEDLRRREYRRDAWTFLSGSFVREVLEDNGCADVARRFRPSRTLPIS